MPTTTQNASNDTAATTLSVPSDLQVQEKVNRIQQFLGDHYFHPNGMMYSMWFYQGDTARPFNEQTDLGEYRYSFVEREGITHKAWIDGENSSSASGLFLWSQAIRYQVTEDQQALVFAEKAFHSIDTIFKLTEAQGKRGALCKPWGWEASTGTSPDQYICVMHGLWEYRKIAAHAERQRIDALLPAMADWWRQRDYTLVFFNTKWPILPHHAPAMACLNTMAYRVSADQRYLEESRRLLTMAGSFPTWIDRNRRELTHNTGWPTEKNGIRWPKACHGLEYDQSRRPYLLQMFEVGEIWLTIACIDFFLKEDIMLAPLLRQALGRHYKYCRFGLRDDLLTLMVIQTDLERDLWRPIHKPPQESKVQHGTTIDEVCWGDFASRIPDAAIIAHQHAPEFCPGAIGLARNMLAKLDNRRLHWFIDPDGQQIDPPRRWILNLLSSDVPSFTLLAYWRARQAGFNLQNTEAN